jgi:hypothetical protein
MTDERDATLEFLTQKYEKPAFYLPDEAPAAALALFLFLKSDDKESQIQEAKALFPWRPDSQKIEAMIAQVKKNKTAFACYKKALEAIIAGTIEEYHRDPEPSPEAPNNVADREVYSISFLIWADKEGYGIPSIALEKADAKIHHYLSSQGWRATERERFPVISQKQFSQLSKEPLWSLNQAVLYSLGYKTDQDDEAIGKFLEYKKRAKKLFAYIEDGHAAEALKTTGQQYQLDGTWDLSKAKVIPSHFIEWAKRLPLYLPTLEDETKLKPKQDQELSSRERATLLKMILGMAKDGWGYDPKEAKSPFPKELEGILDRQGFNVSDDTIRKKLKEASDLLD